MKKIFIVFMISALFGSCTTNDSDKSNYHQPQPTNQIIDLFIDLQLYESLINTHKNFNNKTEQDFLFQQILEKHQITVKELDSVLQYMQNNIEFYKQVIDSAQIKIENMDSISLPLIKMKDVSNEFPIK